MSKTKFTLQTLELLQGYFPVDGEGASGSSFHYLKGYLTALACSPVTVPFDQWWGVLKGLPGVSLESGQTEDELLPLMMILMDKTLESVVAGQTPIPEPAELNDYDYGTAPIEQWCQGFMEGLKLSEELWFALEDAQDNLELSFGVVALLATREKMKHRVDAEQFDERMNRAQQLLPQIVQNLYQLGKARAAGLNSL